MTADYTFVNERMAQHHGILSVYGSRLRRVSSCRSKAVNHRRKRDVDGLPFGTRGGMRVPHSFPPDGEYELWERVVRNVRGGLMPPGVKQYCVGCHNDRTEDRPRRKAPWTASTNCGRGWCARCAGV